MPAPCLLINLIYRVQFGRFIVYSRFSKNLENFCEVWNQHCLELKVVLVLLLRDLIEKDFTLVFLENHLEIYLVCLNFITIHSLIFYDFSFLRFKLFCESSLEKKYYQFKLSYGFYKECGWCFPLPG